MTRIAILYPGEMGMVVGAALLCAGHQVTTCVAGRSAGTRDRAVAAGFRIADGLPAAVTEADAVISLVPPAAALDTARGFAAAVAAGRAAPPLFIDANSVSPTTMTAVAAVIATAGACCVDGAVLGRADRLTGGGTVMVSGPDADAVAEMMGSALPVRIVGAAIGDASAIKMCFAGFNKGLVALFIEMVSAAGRIGQADHLLGLLRAFYPASVETIERLLPGYPEHVARRAQEMAELESWLGELGQVNAMAAAAREVFQHLEAAGLERHSGRTAAEVLDNILARNALTISDR